MVAPPASFNCTPEDIKGNEGLQQVTHNFYHVFLCRHDDLREMLDNTKDGPKLDAMRRIVGVGLYLSKDLM